MPAEQLPPHSQPSTALPLQFVNPVLHVKPHTPDVHVRVEFARVGHTKPHVLQLLTSPEVATSQPSPDMALQFPKPILQVGKHMPLPHEAVLFGMTGQPAPPVSSVDPLQLLSRPSQTSVPAMPGVHVCGMPPTQLDTVF